MAKEKPSKPIYDYETLKQEREYSITWYSVLWRVLRPVVVGLIALLLVIGLCAKVYGSINEAFFTPVDENDTQPIPFTVESGSSLNKVAVNLEESGLIKSSTVFKYYCDFGSMGQKIQAGSYTFQKSMNMFEIAELLTAGDGKATVTDITIIPGMDIRAVADMLQKQGLLKDSAEFLHICETGEGVTDYEFVDAELKLSTAKQRTYLLEGYLAPNTYEVYLNATPKDIIRKLLSQTDKVFTAEWETRAQELGMTMDDAIILASLIEKEAKKSDFAKVSAVFHNRVRNNMALQSDPTIHYITGERRMSLRASDLAAESPYNTYKYKGLPAGPICNPSPEAIYAALYPDESYLAEKYLYFCSKDPNSGELYFSRTLEEHENAVAVYAPLWKAYDEERGL